MLGRWRSGSGSSSGAGPSGSSVGTALGEERGGGHSRGLPRGTVEQNAREKTWLGESYGRCRRGGSSQLGRWRYEGIELMNGAITFTPLD